jgi:hypothetical protein
LKRASRTKTCTSPFATPLVRAARRRLEDYVRRLRGDVKGHSRVHLVRADKLGSKSAAEL